MKLDLIFNLESPDRKLIKLMRRKNCDFTAGYKKK